MAWRTAYSIDVLRAEVWAISPGQVIGTIGDLAHQGTWSDHNPNAAGVVCAADIMPGNRLDLTWVANRIAATDPPALKYVIWGDRIWFPGVGWQPYRGTFHSHVHVSVGWGPDGQSTGPYDDRSPWGLLTLQEDDVKFTVRESSGSIWLCDFMTRRAITTPAEWKRLLEWGASGRVGRVVHLGDLPATESIAWYGTRIDDAETIQLTLEQVAAIIAGVKAEIGKLPTPPTPDQIADEIRDRMQG